MPAEDHYNWLRLLHHEVYCVPVCVGGWMAGRRSGLSVNSYTMSFGHSFLCFVLGTFIFTLLLSQWSLCSFTSLTIISCFVKQALC